jgi:hypothetical protein
MPTKRNYKKKSYAKKKSYTITKTTGPGMSLNFPLPRRYLLKTRYFEKAINLDSGAIGTPVSYVFNLNSLYDPDYSGIGQQPIGFDQFMNFYDHYTVMGAKVRVDFINTDTIHSQTVVLQLKDDFTTSTDVEAIIENGNCRYLKLGPRDSGSATGTLTLNVSMRKFFGVKDILQPKYSGQVSSSPNDSCYLHVINSPDFSVDNATVRCSVLIQFVAMLTEPKQAPRS